MPILKLDYQHKKRGMLLLNLYTNNISVWNHNQITIQFSLRSGISFSHDFVKTYYIFPEILVFLSVCQNVIYLKCFSPSRRTVVSLLCTKDLGCIFLKWTRSSKQNVMMDLFTWWTSLHWRWNLLGVFPIS